MDIIISYKNKKLQKKLQTPLSYDAEKVDDPEKKDTNNTDIKSAKEAVQSINLSEAALEKIIPETILPDNDTLEITEAITPVISESESESINNTPILAEKLTEPQFTLQEELPQDAKSIEITPPLKTNLVTQDTAEEFLLLLIFLIILSAKK